MDVAASLRAFVVAVRCVLRSETKFAMTFDTEKFIREIESQKAIWDISSEEYSDRDVRRKRWEGITNMMCEKNLTEKEKKEFGKSLQQKWKNIRTSFSRELKRRAGAKSGSAASRKSPYVYFDQLQFLSEAVVNNTTQASVDKTGVAKSNDEGGSVQNRSPVTKKKKKADDESLVGVLKQSIAMRENRELNQESDSDRLFMLSLLEDFKKIPEHRRLSTKMELIDVIKRAQMLPLENHHSEFGLFRQGYSDYEPGTSTAGPYRRRYTTQLNYRPEASGSGQYRHGYSIQPNYGPEASGCGQSRRGYSTPVPDRQDTITGYDEVLSPTDTTGSDMTQNSEILDLFQESAHL